MRRAIKFLIAVIVYLLAVLLLEVFIGASIKDFWDKLLNWARKKTK